MLSSFLTTWLDFSFFRYPDHAIDNAKLYPMVAELAGISSDDLQAVMPIGHKGEKHNVVARKIRWFQQTLKHAGIIEKVPGKKGVWSLVKPANKAETLDMVMENVAVAAYSTHLGIAILGWAERVFSGLDQEISCIITSPPYPLKNAREYGNPKEAEYVDWICKTLEPVIKRLAPGGSVCLNVSNDVFMDHSPARSLYQERLVLALHDRLGLHKMDNLIWANFSKAPGPIQWASKTRFQLNNAYESVYWMTNDPLKVMSNNQRVLQPHTPEHLKLIAKGGYDKYAVNSDGAHRKYPGSYGNPTEGKIPRNVLQFGHACGRQRAYKAEAEANGWKAHGAPMPYKLVKFLLEFLTVPGQLVVDPMAGSATLADAAEDAGNPWIISERILQYIMGSSYRFAGRPGFERHLTA